MYATRCFAYEVKKGWTIQFGGKRWLVESKKSSFGYVFLGLCLKMDSKTKHSLEVGRRVILNVVKYET